MRTTDRRRGAGLLPLVLTVAMVPVLLGLGTWQVLRLDWKQDLLQRIDDRLAAAPVPLPASIEVPEDWDYRPVSVEGRLLHDREMRLLSQFEEGRLGVRLIVPLVRSDVADADPVLVDRGWIPEDAADTDIDRPPEPVVITGIARIPDQKGLFTPANDPEAGDWYWRDVLAMGRSAGLEAVAPVVVEATGPNDGGLPLAGPSVVDIPDNHLQYALTWYALAIALLVIYLLYRRRQRNEAGDNR